MRSYIFLFLFCSVGKLPSEDSKSADGTFRERRRRQLSSKKSSSLGIEAFRLSDQAFDLLRRGILTKRPLLSRARSHLETRRPARRSHPCREDSHAVNFPDTIFSNYVQLNGSVIINTRTESVVEAILFAVPLPIISLQTDDRLKFKHVFPTKSDRESNLKESKAYIRRFLGKIIDGSRIAGSDGSGQAEISKDLAMRLMDPHLLLVLGAGMDENVFADLCQALIATMDNKQSISSKTCYARKVPMPTQIIPALIIMRDALEGDGH